MTTRPEPTRAELEAAIATLRSRNPSLWPEDEYETEDLVASYLAEDHPWHIHCYQDAARVRTWIAEQDAETWSRWCAEFMIDTTDMDAGRANGWREMQRASPARVVCAAAECLEDGKI